jgi:SAM-dependent methyltransferase
MYPDVVDLREFYESEQGLTCRRLLRAHLRDLWPNVAGLSLLGFGYATPYLRPFLGEAQRVMAMMPAPQGVTWWPREGPNHTALCEETALPLPDACVDRLLLMHALEHTGHSADLLQEAARILTANGRVIIMVPHRGGFWSREAGTPFGYGFSFSQGHLKRILAANHFQVERVQRALFMPSFAQKLFPSAIDGAEKFGQRFLPTLAGVLLVEATRQVYLRPAREKSRVSKPVLLPMRDIITSAPSRNMA